MLACFLVVFFLAITSGYDDFKGFRAGIVPINEAILKKTPSLRSGAGACTTPYGSGACVDTGDCTGTHYAGYCPGAANIQCCVGGSSCTTPSGSGTCVDTSVCDGNPVPGYCPGSSSIQCCISGGGGGGGGPYGIDISSSLSPSAASCMVNSNFGGLISPRGYQSLGNVDPLVCSSLQNAKAAGFKTRDVYIFPDPTGSKSARMQMTELVNHISSNCKDAWSGRIWLDIEGSQYWKGDFAANKQFYQELYDSCAALGVRCGVYSSYYMWQSIFGSTAYCYGQESPLWYAHYDGVAAFSDFTPFGCWSSPFAKQFRGDTSLCGMNVDENYSPYF